MIDSEKTLSLLGLLEDGVDVADLGDGFENLLLEILVVLAFVFRFLDHVVVVLHQGPPQRRLLALHHLSLELSLSVKP